MYKVITPIATEPVTLAEAKNHLRLDSASASDNVSTSQSIAPGSHAIAASYTLVGSAVDVLGKTAIVNLNSGTNGAGGTVDAKIQESDDGTTYTDWSGGAFTQVTTLNDNAVQEKQYTGSKQYIRVVATVAVAACEFGADVLVYTGSAVEDTQIEAWITAAREYAEAYTGRAMATQTLEQLMDGFPCGDNIELDMPPLQSVSSIKYKDSAGTETTMAVTTDYIVDSDREPGRVVLPYGESWPSFVAYPVNPIRIQYITGYYASNPLPKALWAGMLVHIGLLYKYRDAEIPDAAMNTVKALYAPYRIRWF
ncbi:MAG: hypothetical protein M0R74_03335 [Dehalococcoidia bacterium]|nr:hypothetical protein [Dehalococcoidia bacterium]